MLSTGHHLVAILFRMCGRTLESHNRPNNESQAAYLQVNLHSNLHVQHFVLFMIFFLTYLSHLHVSDHNKQKLKHRQKYPHKYKMQFLKDFYLLLRKSYPNVDRFLHIKRIQLRGFGHVKLADQGHVEKIIFLP